MTSEKSLPAGGSGCRVFTWNGEALVSDEAVWPTATLVASCNECPEVPGTNHYCGIRAQDSLMWIIGMVGDKIPGYVDLLGRVIREGDSYRAEAARITELHVELPHEVAREIAAKYPGVWVVHGACMPPEGPPCEYWGTS